MVSQSVSPSLRHVNVAHSFTTVCSPLMETLPWAGGAFHMASKGKRLCLKKTFLLRGGHLWDSHHLSWSEFAAGTL